MGFDREMLDNALSRLRREAQKELEASKSRLKERHAAYREELESKYEEAARRFAEKLR